MALNGLQKDHIDQETLDLLVELNIPIESEKPEVILWKAISAVQSLKLVANPRKVNQSKMMVPSQKESLPFCHLRAGQIIAEAIIGKRWNLVEEGLLLLKALNKHLHPIALPATLGACQTKYEWWPLLSDGLGERALWISAQREAWQWWPSIMQDDMSLTNKAFLLEYLIRRRQLGGAITPEDVKRLETSDRKRILEVVSKAPTSLDSNILSHFARSRGAQIRRKSLNALLRISGSVQSEETTRFSKQYFKASIKINKKQLTFDTNINIPFQEINFKLADVESFKQYFSNPVYRLLSFCPVMYIFQQKKRDIPFLCQQIIGKESLEKLCQIVILSCSNYGLTPWIKTLATTWMKYYPEGNTIGIDFGPLLEIIPPTL